jgi:hypothetical protein
MEKGFARADHLMRAAFGQASTLLKMLDWGFSAQAADQGVMRADATFGGMYRDGQCSGRSTLAWRRVNPDP